SAEGAFDRHRPVAGLERAGLVVALVARGEAEEVHLVVARHALAGIVVHHAGAADMPFIRTRYGDGAGNDPELVIAGGARKEILDRARAVGFTGAQLVGVLAPDHVEVLWQRDEARAGGRRGGDEAPGSLE